MYFLPSGVTGCAAKTNSNLSRLNRSNGISFPEVVRRKVNYWAVSTERGVRRPAVGSIGPIERLCAECCDLTFGELGETLEARPTSGVPLLT